MVHSGDCNFVPDHVTWLGHWPTWLTKFEKNIALYGSLSFRVYDWQRPRLDTEWLLSTLFDASLLSTSKPPETAALFLLPAGIARRCSVRRTCRKPYSTLSLDS